MTPGGQTPYPILTIFYRFPEGTIANMVMANEDPTLKNVGARLFTDRHTDTQTQTHRHSDRQTDMTDFMIVAHHRWATIINSLYLGITLALGPFRKLIAY